MLDFVRDLLVPGRQVERQQTDRQSHQHRYDDYHWVLAGHAGILPDYAFNEPAPEPVPRPGSTETGQMLGDAGSAG
jgi:hypothetical protein